MNGNSCSTANGNGTMMMHDSGSAERAAQRDYWLAHTAGQPTVEAMMLDSKAAEIDQLERPEVRSIFGRTPVRPTTSCAQPPTFISALLTAMTAVLLVAARALLCILVRASLLMTSSRRGVLSLTQTF